MISHSWDYNSQYEIVKGGLNASLLMRCVSSDIDRKIEEERFMVNILQEEIMLNDLLNFSYYYKTVCNALIVDQILPEPFDKGHLA